MATPLALRPVRAGDLVALAAPAGPVAPERIRGAVEILEARGLRVRVREDMASRTRYLAGSDERRTEELLSALLDPEVAAVFLARGGYGGQRLLLGLGDLAGAPAKPVVGFSDNTALLNHLRGAFGWPSLHGPHPQREKAGELDAVLACLGYFGAPTRPEFRELRVHGRGESGAVVGEVAGGCLSLVVSSVGTPYEVQFRKRIAFLEDTAEPVYRIDRMLHQLLASGALNGALAVVFGVLESFVPRKSGEELAHLEELLGQFAASVRIPVLSGLPCGHTEPHAPLPLGPSARVDAEAGALTFLESLVED